MNAPTQPIPEAPNPKPPVSSWYTEALVASPHRQMKVSIRLLALYFSSRVHTV